MTCRLWWWRLVGGVCFSDWMEEVSCESVLDVILSNSGRCCLGNVIPGRTAAVALEEVFVPGRQALVTLVEKAAVVAESLSMSVADASRNTQSEECLPLALAVHP